ncbi:hypothetical protein AB6C46_10770 [Vibrio sp. 10N.237.312.C02]|uniref:hypothetical protein n=1 Tax=Vibrio TaxID=662 RepID=UPI0010559C59|nr:hypothetical protein [Vibrio tasmaniensis]
MFENCGIPAISNLMAMEFPISDKEQFCQLLGCTFKQCVEFGFSPDAKEVPTLSKSRYIQIRNKIQLEANEGTEWYRTFHLTPRPIQPLLVDEKRGLIFKENAIVTYLLDNNPNGLTFNDLYRGLSPCEYVEDYEQFAQLIGYPLEGFLEMNSTSEESAKAAKLMYEHGFTELEARNKVIELIANQ